MDTGSVGSAFASEVAASKVLRSVGSAVRSFVREGDLVELRIPNTRRGTLSGYFDDLRILEEAARQWDGRAEGIYFTLNPVRPDLKARANNRLRHYAKHTTADADILSRFWFLIDVDPVRPAGISSTDLEHEAATTTTREVYDFLLDFGFPCGSLVLADSGNGGHVLVRLELRNDQESASLLRQCLEGLDLRFSSQSVQIDKTTYNAARITKLYGTLAAKGDTTTERPHRRSGLIHVPEPIEVAHHDLVVRLASLAPARKHVPPSRHHADFDLEGWISEHALPVVAAGPWQGGWKWVLNPCPWNSDHTNRAAYVVRLPDGSIAAGCHHNGCAGKNWADLRRLFEPNRRAHSGCIPAGSANRVHDGASPEEREDPVAGVSYPFRLTRDGVYCAEESEQETGWAWFCSRLEVNALTRDSHGREWGRLLTVIDADGTRHQWAMPMAMMAGDGTSYREELHSLGLRLVPGRKGRERLHSYIASTLPSARVRCVSRVGWHENVFVLPEVSIGETDERVMLQTQNRHNSSLECVGTLDEWRENVARFCVNNSRLAFAVSTAFTAPLLAITGDESGGFHLRGASSVGKTTALQLAGSACGGGGLSGYVRSWRATANGLESVAQAHCDLLLCLDEMSQVAAREAGEVAYMLANGSGKSRARRDGSAREPPTWRLIFLSTGELSLSEKMNEAGQRVRAGQETRLVDVPADAGAGFGIFEDLHGFPSGDAFAKHLRDAAKLAYGSPVREYLLRITSQRSGLGKAITAARKRFVEANCPDHADGQVKRVASRFGLVAAAGELAATMGILPWPADEAERAAARCFKAWLEQRGGALPAEVTEGLTQVRLFFEQHGESRFAPFKGGDRTTINRAGFRRAREDGGTDFFVLPTSWKTEVCKGFDGKALARELATRGRLIPDPGDGKLSRRQRLPGLGTKRVYHVTDSILGGHDA